MVPFDGSPLARTALARAAAFGEARDEAVVAATVIPSGREYARERGWLDPGSEFDAGEIRAYLRAHVESVAPEARFRCQHVDSRLSYGDIARRLRDIARDEDATVVFLGSENVGRIAKPVGSIGGNVAARTDYDLYLVQRADE